MNKILGLVGKKHAWCQPPRFFFPFFLCVCPGDALSIQGFLESSWKNGTKDSAGVGVCWPEG